MQALGSNVRAGLCGAGRWEARIGIPGSKHIYLGLYNDEKEAARMYDAALVRLRGTAAATNFALSDYRLDLAAYHKMQQVPGAPNPSPRTLCDGPLAVRGRLDGTLLDRPCSA